MTSLIHNPPNKPGTETVFFLVPFGEWLVVQPQNWQVPIRNQIQAHSRCMLTLWVERNLEKREETSLRASKNWQADFRNEASPRNLLELNLGLKYICKWSGFKVGLSFLVSCWYGPREFCGFFWRWEGRNDAPWERKAENSGPQITYLDQALPLIFFPNTSWHSWRTLAA